MKVKKRQLHIRNDPGKIEAGMKILDKVHKIFDLLSTSGSGTNDVVDISFVQGCFCSRVLSEDLFLNLPSYNVFSKQNYVSVSFGDLIFLCGAQVTSG